MSSEGHSRYSIACSFSHSILNSELLALSERSYCGTAEVASPIQPVFEVADTLSKPSANPKAEAAAEAEAEGETKEAIMVVNDSAQCATQNLDRAIPNGDLIRLDCYPLNTNFQGTTRLALQQYIWQQALGFNIHPSIPQPRQTASVADVACGTALWLIEVGRELPPSCDLHGFDINLGQAPVKRWLPANVHLHNWNLFEGVPETFAGKFDLVHVRLVSVAVKDNDPIPIIKNLFTLLKPGGYLQWDEIDLASSYVVRADLELDPVATSAWCEFISKTESKRDSGNDWRAEAVKLLQENGFREAKRYDLVDLFRRHMELMRFNNDQLMVATEQYIRHIYPADSEQGLGLLRTLEQASKEAERGATIITPPICWVAVKPS